MPFEWTLNPYRGCTHGCHYCYARRYQTQFELGSDDEFASIIFVKTNFVDTLRAELDKPSWKGDYVVVGAATDCYQPIEGYYKLTRGSLEALCAQENPQLVEGYTQLYARKYAPGAYRKEVSGLIGMLKKKYGLTDARPRSHSDPPTPPDAAPRLPL